MAACIQITGVAQTSLHLAAADDSLPAETPALPFDTDALSQPGERIYSQPPASKKTSFKDELLQHLMQVRHALKICFCNCSLFLLHLVVVVLVSSVGPALHTCRSPWPHSIQAVTMHSYLGIAENALQPVADCPGMSRQFALCYAHTAMSVTTLPAPSLDSI